MRIVLVATVLLALLAAAAPAQAAKRRVPQGFFGVMYDRGIAAAPEDQQEREAARMARSGVESIRTTFSWADAQPTPVSPFGFERTDALVARAIRRNLRVLPIVIYSPTWARRDPDDASSPPRSPGDYAAYLRALVGRYGPAGTFWNEHPELPRRPLREWQIWNEPHMAGYWRDSDRPWQTGYVELLRAAHAAVKQADPGAKVVLAGLADYVWSHLRKVYAAGGRGYFDVVTLNFYTSYVSGYVKALKRVRSVMRGRGGRRMPVWLTEVTWPAAKGRMAPGARWHRAWFQTDRGMAARLTQTYDALVKAQRRYLLKRVYWYTWGSQYERGDLFDFSGLIKYGSGRSSGRPALRAYQRSARRYEGCSKNSFGRCR